LIRAPTFVTWAGLAFQIVVVVTAGFIFWLWLLSIYPPASVAAFSFLSPVFGVAFGWALLGETLSPALLFGLAAILAGLWLVSRPEPGAAAPRRGGTGAAPP
jgi:drug/metabolite transporter (DMT)-like permease